MPFLSHFILLNVRNSKHSKKTYLYSKTTLVSQNWQIITMIKLIEHWSCWSILQLCGGVVLKCLNVQLMCSEAEVNRNILFSMRLFPNVSVHAPYLCFLITICGLKDQRHNIVPQKFSPNICILTIYRSLYFHPLRTICYTYYTLSFIIFSFQMNTRSLKLLILNINNFKYYNKNFNNDVNN